MKAAQDAIAAEEAAQAEEAPAEEVMEEAAEEPAPVEEVVEEAAEEPAPVEEVVEEAAEEPAPVEEVVEEVAEEPAPVEEVVEEAAEEPAPVEEVVEEVAEEPAPVEEVVEEPVEEPAPVEEVVEEPAEEPAPVEEVVEEPVEEPAPVEEVVEEPVEEVAEEPAPEVTDELAVADAAVAEEPVQEPVPEAELTTRYKRSFTAKIIESDEVIKEYYSTLKNTFLSYSNITSQINWSNDRFAYNNETVAKIGVRGRTLCVYLALNPDEFPDSVYHQKFAGDTKMYERTPLMMKVKSNVGLKRTLRLMELLMERLGTVKDEEAETVDYAAQYLYRSEEELLAEGLIKTAVVEKSDLDF